MSSKQYIGVKMVQAVPAKLVNGCIWPEGLPLPEQNYDAKQDEKSEECCKKRRVMVEDGYLVLEDPTYPRFVEKEAFEKEYRDTMGMPFGMAVEAMKQGSRVGRWAWWHRGDIMYVFTTKEVEFSTDADISEFEKLEDGVEVYDMMVQRTEKGTLMPGWLPSQEDIFAEDWYIVDKANAEGQRSLLPF